MTDWDKLDAALDSFELSKPLELADVLGARDRVLAALPGARVSDAYYIGDELRIAVVIDGRTYNRTKRAK